MNIKLKKRVGVSLCGALLALPVSLLPVTTNAATMNSSLEKVLNGSVIVSSGSFGNTNGTTSIDVDFFDTTGIWVPFNASTSAIDEDFILRINNKTGFDIDNLHVEIRKLNGGSISGFRPDLSDWGNSLTSPLAVKPEVSFPNSFLMNTDNSQRISLNLAPALSGQAQNSSMTLNLKADDPANGTPFPFDNSPWVGFNNDRANFYLNIDLNGVDDNFPVVIPLPPAVWLLGSGLVGLVSLSRNKRKA